MADRRKEYGTAHRPLSSPGKAPLGLLEGARITPLDLPCTTTAALIEQGHEAIRAAAGDGAELALEDATLLSPITNEAKVLCQGANYRQHMIDSGMNPDDKSFNMFFTKSSGSITGPGGRSSSLLMCSCWITRWS